MNQQNKKHPSIVNCQLSIVKKKGFTFIELMTVIAIIAIMTAVTIVSLNNSRTRKEVEVASREVSAAIREAQNDALTGKKTDDTHLPCIYWFKYVNPTTYTISYDYHTGSTPDCTPPLTTQVLATYTIKNGVTFPSSFSSLSFQVPFSNISGLSPDPMAIVVNKGGVNYAVCVNSAGNVWEKPDSTSCP